MIPKEIIIIGGGASIQEGIALELKERIKDKFVIALNFAYRHFDHTCLCFVDQRFYIGKLLSDATPETAHIINYQHVEALKQESLIVGIQQSQTMQKLDNTILLKNSTTFERNILDKGCYRAVLCGLIGLTLACYLVDFKGVIYLLGYDSNNTHYYNDIAHRGIDFNRFFCKPNTEKYWKCYTNLKDVKIYNVSPESNILSFEKISYVQMFSLLSTERHNQNEIRRDIREKLGGLNV